jgi:hypothetical protein
MPPASSFFAGHKLEFIILRYYAIMAPSDERAVSVADWGRKKWIRFPIGIDGVVIAALSSPSVKNQRFLTDGGKTGTNWTDIFPISFPV